MEGLQSVSIRLRTVEDVKEYIHIAEKLVRDCNVKSGSYIVDGKSIMGIFSLDLSRKLTFEYDKEDTDIANQIIARFGV